MVENCVFIIFFYNGDFMIDWIDGWDYFVNWIGFSIGEGCLVNNFDGFGGLLYI